MKKIRNKYNKAKAGNQPRIVVAGQVPPPTGGQNVMVRRLLDELASDGRVKVEHLAFRFTRQFSEARSAGLGKLIEVIRVILRLIRLRLDGPIDLVVYPPGGPQTVPLIRDLLLLPWVQLLCRRVALHFHAGGIADRLETGGLLPCLAASLYGRCQLAIVMTDFNRRDPVACGIHEIIVVPHLLDDCYDPSLVQKDDSEQRILSMGHLCPDKGTPMLIEAFAEIAGEFPCTVLELAGEPLPPYSFEELRACLVHFGIEQRVRLLGVVHGAEKLRAFGRASLFVFPSIAPYESFGLVMVEAMMWGIPLIVSDWRGNRDVAGEVAAYFDPTDANAPAKLAEAMRACLTQSSSRSAMSRASRQRYEDRFAPTASNSLAHHLTDYVLGKLQC